MVVVNLLDALTRIWMPFYKIGIGECVSFILISALHKSGGKLSKLTSTSLRHTSFIQLCDDRLDVFRRWHQCQEDTKGPEPSPQEVCQPLKPTFIVAKHVMLCGPKILFPIHLHGETTAK